MDDPERVSPEVRRRWAEQQAKFAREYYAEGKEAGRELGRELGRLCAARQMVCDLVMLRLGQLDDVRRARIDACNDRELMSRLILLLAATRDAATIESLLDESLGRS